MLQPGNRGRSFGLWPTDKNAYTQYPFLSKLAVGLTRPCLTCCSITQQCTRSLTLLLLLLFFSLFLLCNQLNFLYQQFVLERWWRVRNEAWVSNFVKSYCTSEVRLCEWKQKKSKILQKQNVVNIRGIKTTSFWRAASPALCSVCFVLKLFESYRGLRALVALKLAECLKVYFREEFQCFLHFCIAKMLTTELTSWQ